VEILYLRNFLFKYPALNEEFSPYSLIHCIMVCFKKKFLFIYLLFFIVLLFICAYKAWVISPPCLHPLPYHPLLPLPLPSTPSIPGRNYFALISNFVEERV
jgi:hypothetical protein